MSIISDVDQQRAGRERIIEEAIINHPDRVGFPGALAIRDWWISPNSGRLDLGLLPIDGSRELVLIEAKAASSADAAAKVIGQLLMYYAGALQLGAQGLACLRAYASAERTEACSTLKKSVLRFSGGIVPKAAAWSHVQGGQPLRPEQVALFLALDAEPPRALRPTLAVLQRQHGLQIGLIIVQNGQIRTEQDFR